MFDFVTVQADVKLICNTSWLELVIASLVVWKIPTRCVTSGGGLYTPATTDQANLGIPSPAAMLAVNYRVDAEDSIGASLRFSAVQSLAADRKATLVLHGTRYLAPVVKA